MLLHGERVTPCRGRNERLGVLAITARDMRCRGIKEGLQEIAFDYVAAFTSC